MKNMKKAIIIPIYLRFNQPEELPALEALRLAKRAIKSLNRLEDQDFTLILPVCFDLVDRGEFAFLEMDKFLRQKVKDLRQERTLIFSSHHLKYLREYLDQKNFRKYYSLIDLKGFSKIRNTGLLLAQALSTDVAIFIDHDEVVEDPHYLSIACEYLNKRWNGTEVVGKGGFYENYRVQISKKDDKPIIPIQISEEWIKGTNPRDNLIHDKLEILLKNLENY